MRYFTTTVSHYHTVQFESFAFRGHRKMADVGLELLELGRLYSGYIRQDGRVMAGWRTGDWNVTTQRNFAFFISYSSKYAEHSDWISVRSWFKTLEPAEQAQLVRARTWYQCGARRFLSQARPWLDAFHAGNLVLADLSTGAVVMAVHTDAS